MASTVEVLCPNGRRQNVKITPNSKLLQILEDVCKKQGFDATDYDLKHGRKTLDLSLSFRFSGLPNNSKLELVKAEKSRVEAEVHIALDVMAADGSSKRLQEQFSPGTTLWEVLLHFQKTQNCPQLMACDSKRSPPEQLVCNYLTEQVIGEDALRATSLKSLGLTGGRAVLRLLKRPVEASVMAEIAAQLEKDRVRQEKLEAIGKQKREEAASSNTSLAGGSAPPDSQPSHLPMQVEEQTSTTTPSQHRPRCICVRQEPSPMEVDPVPHSGGQHGGGQGGARPKAQGRAQPGNSHEQSAQELRALGVPGLEVYTPNDFHQLTPQEQQLARQQMRQFMEHCGMVEQEPSVQPTFTNFKFPEETKGKDLYHNELSEFEAQDYQPCDRQALVFNSEDSLPVRRDTEVDEEFFELTEEDVKKRQKSLTQQLSSMQEESLMTKAMREQKMEEIYEKYPRIVIRIVFPDKMVLQGLFRPRETVHALRKFVQEHLQDKSLIFELYTTPPKCVLTDNTKTMIQAHLAPASNVYFKTEEPRDHYLEASLLRAKVSRLEAEKSLYDLFPASPEEGGGREFKHKGQGKRSSATTLDSGPQPSDASKSRPPGDKPAKQGTPKWLKLGK